MGEGSISCLQPDLGCSSTPGEVQHVLKGGPLAFLTGSQVLEFWAGGADKQPTSLTLGSSGQLLSAQGSD